MRSIALHLLLPLLLVACQQSQPEKAVQQMSTPIAEATNASASEELSLAQRLSPVLTGYWVSADYLQEVARTRSPSAAFDHAPPAPSSLVISTFSSQKDSVEIGASYGLHEGGNLTLLLQANSQSNSLEIREFNGNKAGLTSELAYQITSTDTTLFYITRKSKTHQLISKTAYRRTGMPSQNAGADLEAGVEQGVNKLLLTGTYTGADSIGQKVTVQFLANGSLSGLPFKKYTIATDFAGPNPGDEVIFDVYTKQKREFAAVYGRDTVRLYTILSSTGIGAGQVDPANTFTRGRLRYQLIRTNRP